MQGLNPITMQCTYSTPCGWCTKWDKKCDNKISEPPAKPYDYLKEESVNQTCESEEDHEWEACGVSMVATYYRCKKCNAYKSVPREEK